MQFEGSGRFLGEDRTRKLFRSFGGGQPLSHPKCYGGGMKRKSKPVFLNRIPDGLDPKLFPPERLFYWLTRPRNPVLASETPIVNMFIEGMLKGDPVPFIYMGGSIPGAPRSVHVSLVFQHEPKGRIYITGYCPERSANRTFALNMIMVIHAWN